MPLFYKHKVQKITGLNMVRVLSDSFKDIFEKMIFIYYMEFSWRKYYAAKLLSLSMLKYELKTKHLATS